MPLIDRRPSLTLSLRRAEVAAFWAVTALAAAALAAVAAHRFGGRSWWGWGVAAGAALLAPGLFWRPWFEDGVAVWNAASSLSACALRRYSLRVGYGLLALAAGPGSRLDPALPPAAASRWAARTSSTGGESHDLYSWARTTGKPWALLLLPLILLLFFLEEEPEDDSPPAATYTLY